MNSIKLYIVSIILMTFSFIYWDNKDSWGKDNIETSEIISSNGYAVEQHSVLTNDGYLLQLTRIPRPQAPVVFLMHGMSASADTWITSLPENSLAFNLANSGYDVWLGNSRGNRYGRNHIHLSVTSKEFWHFSFHEMGCYDLPALLDYTLNATFQSSLHIITSSQGTACFLVLLSERPEYNSIFRTSHHLSPVVFLTSARSPLLNLGTFLTPGSMAVQFFEHREFLPNGIILSWICKYLFSSPALLKTGLKFMMSLLVGDINIDEKLLSNFCQTHPAGSSTDAIIHYMQIRISGKFQRFDYGHTLNLQIFNATDPPEYDLTKVKTCLTLYYGDNDLIADGLDVERLANMLSCAKATKVSKNNWNHYDFMWNPFAKKLIYDSIVSELNVYEKSFGSSDDAIREMKYGNKMK